MKKLLGIFAVASAMFLSGVAYAQAPGMNPGGAPGTTTTVESTTITEDGGGAMTVDAPSGTMAATGGAPIAMALTGILTAVGGLLIRRKIS